MPLFRVADHYGDRLNSFDWLKLIALATMIVDHLGYFLFPDIMLLRAIGRMAFPLFLFLVGYSGSWKVKHDIIVWAALCTGCAALTNHPVFPLDILATIILVRWFMPWCVQPQTINPIRLGIIFFICAFLYLPFYWLADYGTLALLFAIAGFLQRNRPGSYVTILFIICTMTLHMFIEQSTFSFNIPEFICMLLLLTLDAYLMAIFSLRNNETFTLPSGIRRLMQWASRNTLPIYGLHLMALMIADRGLHPEELQHFHWINL